MRPATAPPAAIATFTTGACCRRRLPGTSADEFDGECARYERLAGCRPARRQLGVGRDRAAARVAARGQGARSLGGRAARAARAAGGGRRGLRDRGEVRLRGQRDIPVAGAGGAGRLRRLRALRRLLGGRRARGCSPPPSSAGARRCACTRRSRAAPRSTCGCSGAASVWTLRYSLTGSSWTTAASFSLPAGGTRVRRVRRQPGPAPAFTAQVDHFRVLSEGQPPPPPPGDTTPPVMSGVAATPGATTATVTWTTDEPADSRVEYGLTAAYGQARSAAALVTSHSLEPERARLRDDVPLPRQLRRRGRQPRHRRRSHVHDRRVCPFDRSRDRDLVRRFAAVRRPGDRAALVQRPRARERPGRPPRIDYRVDGGPRIDLVYDPRVNLRIGAYGDFNIELDRLALSPGHHVVTITAADRRGNESTRTVGRGGRLRTYVAAAVRDELGGGPPADGADRRRPVDARRRRRPLDRARVRPHDRDGRRDAGRASMRPSRSPSTPSVRRPTTPASASRPAGAGTKARPGHEASGRWGRSASTTGTYRTSLTGST